MGIKNVVLVLALAICLSMTAYAGGPKNLIAENSFPGENMSGSAIYNEVREGTYDTATDSSLSFRNESLFIIRKDTGMSPNAVDRGVRTPVVVIKGGIPSVAGSWSFSLTDTATRHIILNLYQTADAVFGSGQLVEGGSVTQVTAGGTVLGDRLSLYVNPVGSQNLYRFSLTIKPGSMDGDFIYTAPGVTQPGVAFGSLLSPQMAASAATQTIPMQSTPVQQTEPVS